MGVLNIPNVFSAGQDVRPTGMNDNFAAVSTVVNGGINKDNLANGAITYSRLATDARPVVGYAVGNNGGDVNFNLNSPYIYSSLLAVNHSGNRKALVTFDVSVQDQQAFAVLGLVTLVIDGTNKTNTGFALTPAYETPLCVRYMTSTPLSAGNHTYGFILSVYGSGSALCKMINNGGRVFRMTVHEV